MWRHSLKRLKTRDEVAAAVRRSTLNLDRFIVHLFVRDGSYPKLDEKAGLRSRRADHCDFARE